MSFIINKITKVIESYHVNALKQELESYMRFKLGIDYRIVEEEDLGTTYITVEIKLKKYNDEQWWRIFRIPKDRAYVALVRIQSEEKYMDEAIKMYLEKETN